MMKPVYNISRLAWHETMHIIGAYRLSKDLNLLIVSGGGQFDDYWGGPWGHPYALFKWSLLAKIGRTPFIVLSVGVCTFDSTLSRFFIRCALAASSYRSYRDEGSKDLLSHMGFVHKDRIYPDLAFSYSIPHCGNSHKHGFLRGTVGISPIAYLHPRRWPKANPAIYERYIKELIVFASSLSEQGYSIIFFWTDGSDRQVINEMMGALKSRLAPRLSRHISQAPFSDLDGLFTLLHRIDWAVTSRLHGVLLSHLAGKPVLAISYDKKVNAHMDDMDQSRYCVDIHSFDANTLERKFRALLANGGYIKSTLIKKIAERKNRLGEQYDVVLSTEKRDSCILAIQAGQRKTVQVQ